MLEKLKACAEPSGNSIKRSRASSINLILCSLFFSFYSSREITLKAVYQYNVIKKLLKTLQITQFRSESRAENETVEIGTKRKKNSQSVAARWLFSGACITRPINTKATHTALLAITIPLFT